MAIRPRERTSQDRNHSLPPPPPDLADAAVHLRQPVRAGIDGRFAATDPGIDISRNRFLGRLLHNRRFQFSLIAPNQAIFWIVILSGIFGTVVPGRNFATAITWFIWFCAIFVLMIGIGRGWCAMCPFGGLGEWVQRHTLFRRTTKALGLGWKLPPSWAGYGLAISAGMFVVLTWLEEFFNIAGPGVPIATSFMVLGIVGLALTMFLLFERRTFCRYICPLSSLIGTVGSTGMVAGFRTRDRNVCLSCRTKDCMRGGENGFGCPWYTWPGSADSNQLCGLCSECYKACPQDNIGLFVQPPLTSVIAPKRRRLDVAWVVAALFGLVIFQQVNALDAYTRLDNWLNGWMHFPGYPNPVDYLGIIALVGLALAGAVWVMSRLAGRRDEPTQFALANAGAPSPDGGVALRSAANGNGHTSNGHAPTGTGGVMVAEREPATDTAIVVLPRADVDPRVTTEAPPSPWRTWFMAVMYGLIPLMGADYLARQLPKFFNHALDIFTAVLSPFGIHAPFYEHPILSTAWVVRVQLLVIVAGAAASLYAMWRIAGRDLVSRSRRPWLARLGASAVIAACGVAAFVLYIAMQGAE